MTGAIADPHAQAAQAAPDLASEAALAAGRRALALEAEAIARLAAHLTGPLAGPFAAALRLLNSGGGRIVCAGIGKSGHVARKMAATFASTGAPAFFLHPSEAAHGDLGMVAENDRLIALSKSGETAELAPLLRYAARFGIACVAITAQAQSSLARAADIVLVLPDAPEACAETQAPTTSTLMMMALGDALAVSLVEQRGFRAADFHRFHPGGKLGAALTRVADIMRPIADCPLARREVRLDEGLSIISRGGLGCVLILEPDGRLAGIVADGDVRRAFAAGARPPDIAALMTADPHIAAPSESADSALRRMNAAKISQLPVVAEGRPVGIVHLHDLLRLGVV